MNFRKIREVGSWRNFVKYFVDRFVTKCSLTAEVMLAVSSVAHKRLPSIIKAAYLAYDQTKLLSQSQQY